MKNEKTNLIIWAVVALVIGVIIGTFLVAPVTTGNAKSALENKSIYGSSTPLGSYEDSLASILVSEAECIAEGGSPQHGYGYPTILFCYKNGVADSIISWS